MISRVIVFEDDPSDQKRFEDALKAIGCQVLIISHSNVKKVSQTILKFDPQLAIIDSKFDADIDGLDIIKNMHELYPHMPFIVCSILIDDLNKRNWIFDQYREAPQVKRILGKSPFPESEQLII